MGVELDPAQIKAANDLCNGNILCGGVGSGKSRTILAYYLFKVCGGSVPVNGKGRLQHMKRPMDIYVITTSQKRDKHEWEKEAEPYLIYTKRENSISNVKLTVDSWNNIKKYVNINNAFFVFDEQKVVGYGEWAKTFIKLARVNQWVLLSATPGDKYMDYMPVLIANGYYKNKTDFISQHVIYSHKKTAFPIIDRYVGTKKLDKLIQSLLINIDVNKRTVRHNEVVRVGYNKTLYKYCQSKRWDIYNDEPFKNISALCYTLRKIVNSDEERIVSVLTITEKIPKVIIFYNFDYELEALEKAAYIQGTVVAEWNGHRHDPVPDSDRWVYLVQYTAGAEGWNCITTDTIIFYSQNYSYKIMEQASGRIDRLNTPFTDLYYYHIRSSAQIDLAISRALNEKKKFNERAFAKKL